MKKASFLMLCLVVIGALPSVFAQEGHMKLLAVSETEEGLVGGIADLYLEIKPGSGRVFLETFPLTKIDTQISTRIAKQIACDFAQVDCSQYDFFYTITARSSIIAGPSAGAAISILTFSLIADEPIREDVAITGTINSGGLIGPVGGLEAKTEAAADADMKKVLLPIGESLGNETRMLQGMGNASLDVDKLSKDLGIEVIQVATLDEALYHFAGKRFREKTENLAIDQDYRDTMKTLAVELCSRSTSLQEDLALAQFGDNASLNRLNNAINLSGRGKEAFEEGSYYTSASYCFGANVDFNYLNYLSEDFSRTGLLREIRNLRNEVDEFDSVIESEELKTITDLESYMVVKDRLLEADEFLDRAVDNLNNTNVTQFNMAYARERLASARSWSTFIGSEGREFELNEDVLREACQIKLSEVEERLQYVQLYLPNGLEATRQELQFAYEDQDEERYELCLFKASKAKANVDSVLSVVGVSSSNVDRIVQEKLDIVERNIIEETQKDIFPVLGYSYFEYSNSLKERDVFSSLLYASYALELSDLDIYLEDGTRATINGNNGSVFESIDQNMIIMLVLGILIGVALTKVWDGKRRN